jgi:hypothetical protein
MGDSSTASLVFETRQNRLRPEKDLTVNSMRKVTAVLAAAFIIAVVFAASAQACSYSGARQVFKPWGDQHEYVLAPNGGFESGGSGWSLQGGAALAAENETFHLNASSDSTSLSLPTGSSAVSPPLCMSLNTPEFRMLARNSGNPSSRLRVEATFSLLGLLHTTVMNTVAAGAEWAPTQEMSTVLGLSTIVGTILPSYIQVRITPVGAGGAWQVDDLFVDPFSRH